MTGVADFTSGNYRFLPYAFQYSSGAVAQPGYEIERVQFRKPVPLQQGFERIEAPIRERGRPLTSFCACELRSPAPVHRAGLLRLQQALCRHAGAMGRVRRQDQSGGALNVCPAIDPPAEPSFHAFSFTVPAADAGAELRDRGRRRGAGRQRRLPRAHRALRRDRRGGAARQGGVRARRDGAPARPVRLRAGPTPRRRRSIPCTTCIRSWRTRSCGAARRARG